MKLAKESDSKFLEQFENGHSASWMKLPEFVALRLHNVVRRSVARIEPDSEFVKVDLEKEPLQERHVLTIEAKGALERGDSINLIQSDGSVRRWHKEIDVTLTGEARWNLKLDRVGQQTNRPRSYGYRYGYLGHGSEEQHWMEHNAVGLYLPVPEGIFRPIWERLGRDSGVTSIRLFCRIETFMPDIERSLREPYDSRALHIEEGSWNNYASFETIVLDGAAILPLPKTDTLEEDLEAGGAERVAVSATADVTRIAREATHLLGKLCRRATFAVVLGTIGCLIAFLALLAS